MNGGEKRTNDCIPLSRVCRDGKTENILNARRNDDEGKEDTRGMKRRDDPGGGVKKGG